MELRRPLRFQGNLLCSIWFNGCLANHVLAAAAAAAVFDSGAAATFLPDSPDAPHRSVLHVTTPVETLPIKNVTSHADSGQTAHVTAPLCSSERFSTRWFYSGGGSSAGASSSFMKSSQPKPTTTARVRRFFGYQDNIHVHNLDVSIEQCLLFHVSVHNVSFTEKI